MLYYGIILFTICITIFFCIHDYSKGRPITGGDIITIFVYIIGSIIPIVDIFVFIIVVACLHDVFKNKIVIPNNNKP